jgi:hypothetical protein
MAEFLEGYGVADARRSRIFWRVALAAVLAVVIGLALYFALRTYPARRKVNEFLVDLRQKDYPAAYRLWGCAVPSSPCRDYTFEKFMEDWGPLGPRPGAASGAIARTRYCGPGVVVTLQYGQGSQVHLWYERKDSTIGSAPWPVCAPQPKAYQ